MKKTFRQTTMSMRMHDCSPIGRQVDSPTINNIQNRSEYLFSLSI